MNHRRFMHTTLATMATLAMLATGGAVCAATAVTANAAEDATAVHADINVKKIENLPTDFIGGADISSMMSLEESGVSFKDANGTTEDLFKLLKDNGWNYVRLRV